MSIRCGKSTPGCLDVLKPTLRGRHYGIQRKLSAAQKGRYSEMASGGQNIGPSETFSHVDSRKAIHLSIKHHYVRNLLLRTITDYLKRWGFTPQKPVNRAYKQIPKCGAMAGAVYPQIQARARKEKVEILWDDETGIQNAEYVARGFASNGCSPVV